MPFPDRLKWNVTEALSGIATSEGEAKILCGMNNDIASQIVELSSREDIQLFHPRDRGERFSSIESMRRWYEDPEKCPETFSLLTLRDMRIKELVWFSLRHSDMFPESAYTVGTRIYDDDVLSSRARRSFFYLTHSFMAERIGENVGMWVDVNVRDEKAKHVARQLGYKASTLATGDRLTMNRPHHIVDPYGKLFPEEDS